MISLILTITIQSWLIKKRTKDVVNENNVMVEKESLINDCLEINLLLLQIQMIHPLH